MNAALFKTSIAGLTIRSATEADTAVLLDFIRQLAAFEKLADKVVATEAVLRASLFGTRPYAEALIAELDGKPAAFAIFFTNFSTFIGEPGLSLEDLFVVPAHRGRGLGRAMMIVLARIAVARNWRRFEWSVLDWNTPAIDFYRSLGAVPMSEWTVQRVSGDALKLLSEKLC